MNMRRKSKDSKTDLLKDGKNETMESLDAEREVVNQSIEFGSQQGVQHKSKVEVPSQTGKPNIYRTGSVRYSGVLDKTTEKSLRLSKLEKSSFAKGVY
eukprot:CAMPEP_0116933448 /NCGR_PEP_ID=MMETSP0467-20121206/29049_1 /TAXON_ID=283647 /ORGANISM="Mesodinium pulex, Strain SPMC105" /LENGTH=97 /DNA_ID=CAMNT_0004614343 /DNA_START=335 /DNA_END=628 /DNA_ORIENTATION=-